MKVALVHDYLNEFGGAERVLKCLSEIYPKAPIYTAFCVRGSTAHKEFKNKTIIQSKFAPVLKIWRFYSPLRFLIPAIWGSMNLTEYDLVITSASWYITRGFRVGKNTKVICYCHTPPRWLYGYKTSVGFTKYWPVKVYAAIVGHFLRLYDFNTAQKIDYWITNSKNVKERVEKFYRKDSVVVYPPVEVERIIKETKGVKKENFYLIASRLVGAKGLEEAARAAKKLKFNLKIVGESHGFADVEEKLKKLSGGNIELLGRVSDEALYKLYVQAKGFFALAQDEDFGMTPVEAQAAGTPVIAFNGGGFKESIIDGKTGILINGTTDTDIQNAVKKLERTKWDTKTLQKNAMRFSKGKFVAGIREYIRKAVN